MVPPSGNDGLLDSARKRDWRQSAVQVISIGSWVSVALVVAIWGLLRAGDVWGPATALMFGPRWLLALPPALLIPAAALLRRRSLGPLLLAVLLAIGPIMGFSIPWTHIGQRDSPGLRLRVLTCNMHYGKLDPAPLGQLLADSRPDIVALQEWRTPQSSLFDPRAWHVQSVSGQFLASRYPVRSAELVGADSVGEDGSVMRYELETPFGATSLYSLHFATPREGLHRVIDEGWNGMADLDTGSALRRVQSERLARKAAGDVGPVILVGDFNTPPESGLFRQVWTPYADAFADAGWGWGYTFSTRLVSMRIDHILIGRGLRCDQCWVAPSVGSPHRPVLADVALVGG